MREMAQTDLAQATEAQELAVHNLRMLLRPSQASPDTNALVEITPGAGGLEASAFALELAQLYRDASLKWEWTCEETGTDDVELMPPGEATISLDIRGHDSYNRLRLESGVHKVQRVPVTELRGRMHSSVAGVVVLPVTPKAANEETLWLPSEIRIDTMRSHGAGGQSVNKTESAVRITHIPTGIAVRSDVARNQIENKEVAFERLRAHLMKLKHEADAKAVRDSRAAQKTGNDRSDKIRTYNFPGDRITDHRVPITVKNIADYMEAGEPFESMCSAVAEHELDEHIDAILGSDDA